MTLEDFFTLTEMKDGLTAPARVKELVTVMQKERDCVVKNIGDATRQWSAVASTIAATENKDCLDLFIQLDGLWFIDRWLKDAQKFSNDTSDSFVEESITALLRALEKLHIDIEKSVSSGILISVKNLLGHNSSRVQDRARALFDSWKPDTDDDALTHDVEKGGAFHDDRVKVSGSLAGESGFTDYSARDISPSKGRDEEKHVDTTKDEMMPSVSSDALQPERVDDVQIQTSGETLDHAVSEVGPPDHVGSSVMFKSAKVNLSTKEESPIHCLEETTSVDTCRSVIPKQHVVEGKSDVLELNEYTDDSKQIQKIGSSPEKLGGMEISSVSSALEPRVLSSSADAANASESVIEPHLQNNFHVKDEDHYPEASSFGDVRTVVSEGKSGMDDIGSPNHCRSTLVFRATYQGGECNTNVLQDSSGSECKLGNPEDPDTSFSRIEDGGEVDEVKEHASNEGEDLANDLKPALDAKNPDVIDKRTDIELDYNIVDAIEVARRVAIEVEREVVDRRELSCSSSEKISEGGIRQPDSPDSINGKESSESQRIDSTAKEEPTGLNLSAEALLKGKESLISAENLDTKREKCIQDTEIFQVTEVAQDPGDDAEKGLCEFDLNQEVCSEDIDQPGNPISTPISVVSASRAAAAPGLPVSPLQFEGALGWKGSAATSAFRPASPRRIPEGDKTLSTGGSCNSSKQRQDCLDFDLNVAEDGDDKITDLTPGKQIPVSSGLLSGESSVEASPRRSERLKLDLNRVSDDGDGLSDWKIEGRLFHHRNGHRSPSPSSSSSSMQPFLRNIDLNDQPCFYNDSLDQQSYLGKSSLNLNASGGLKSDDSIISIMGARVEVNQKDFVPQTLTLPNGRISEPAMDLNLARTGGVLGMSSTVPYAHSPAFGYDGLTTGPTMSFSSTVYGSGATIPYMVDSREATVAPQIVASASTVPPAFSQPPFIMSMASTFQGANGAGSSRPNFDLNSVLMIEGGNRDSGALRQLFNTGQGRPIDEHLRANSQPSSSAGVGGKRKEPDGGWEFYPFNYKHHQPPWK
uniref:TFIIS N-terminal domain-containing protein n=1 Tax=Davidia involucrata TaxID=16924 RepID=A0A5B6ZCZ1_DAVIN